MNVNEKALTPQDVFIRLMMRSDRLQQLLIVKAPEMIVEQERRLLDQAHTQLVGREVEVIKAGVFHAHLLRCEAQGHDLNSLGRCRWCGSSE